MSTIQSNVKEKTLITKLNALKPFIGNTPLFEIKNFELNPKVKLYVKLEWLQLSGSIKIRAAYQIIRQAIENNQLDEDRILLDATSGNTGIAYAAICAALNIKLTICIPENASKERKLILQNYGARLVFTSKFEGTDGAQEYAKLLYNSNPDKYYYADQYANKANSLAHYLNTAPEIYNALEGKITHFVNGLGTTGTFTGAGTRFKEYNQNIQLISLQPDNPLHGLEGWKHLETAKVPEIYNDQLADENRLIDTENAFRMIKTLAQKEGLLVSPSAAANLTGALEVARGIKEGIVVSTFADNADKYSEILKDIL
ncbi:MAG TPA: cysteine synthase family protein [Saprospiraceae bacterium]|nr:cysteine synthase family protein [Saprospiraceae bacterium]